MRNNMMRILLFHINVFKQNSICDLCKDLGIDVSVASEADLSRTIGQIAGIQAAPGYTSKPGRPVPFHEEMMVFCGLDPDQLDQFLTKYRQREISPIALKAVLTPYNARWTPGRLCVELKKEQHSLGGE